MWSDWTPDGDKLWPRKLRPKSLLSKTPGFFWYFFFSRGSIIFSSWHADERTSIVDGCFQMNLWNLLFSFSGTAANSIISELRLSSKVTFHPTSPHPALPPPPDSFSYFPCACTWLNGKGGGKLPSVQLVLKGLSLAHDNVRSQSKVGFAVPKKCRKRAKLI